MGTDRRLTAPDTVGSQRLRIVILISGRGSNLQAILAATARGDLPVDIAAVISNCPTASGLEYARQAGVVTAILDHRQFVDRAEFDAQLRDLIDHYQPDLVLLAGFMRILTDSFVNHYRGKLLNIHPSLLPRYRGLHTHERVLAAGECEHGASVHFVTPELDSGPVILQAKVPVFPTDTPDQLAARVLQQEHRIYPQVIRWFAEGRIQLGENDTVLFDQQPLAHPLLLNELSGTSHEKLFT